MIFISLLSYRYFLIFTLQNRLAMKKIGLIVIMLCVGIAAHSQSVTLLTFGGYTFKHTVNYGNSKGVLGDGFQWGGGIEVGIDDEKAIEIIYQRQDATVSYFDFSNPSNSDVIKVGVNYIMAGGTNYFPLNDMFSAFGTVDLGAAIFDPMEDFQTITRFAWGIRGGLKVAASEAISLRIHAQLLSPVQGFGGGLWFGTGGTGGGVSTYSTIYQFNLGGSLNFKLR